MPNLRYIGELESTNGELMLGDTRKMHWFAKGTAPSESDPWMQANLGDMLPGPSSYWVRSACLISR